MSRATSMLSVLVIACLDLPGGALAFDPLTPCTPSDVTPRLRGKALATAVDALSRTVQAACRTECGHCYEVKSSQDGEIILTVHGLRIMGDLKTQIEAFVVVDASTGLVLRNAVLYSNVRDAATGAGT
jgi:hypothetical protein